MIRRKLACASVMVFASGAFAVSAGAQETVLEEIIVTAQKRAQNIQDVPISVTAIRGDVLDNISAGGMDIRFLAARVPSLNVESSFGRAFPRFYIRGLGNTDFDLNSSQPVSLIYDEVVLENPIAKGMPAFDLDRIEVLRGPQGTLFGRNTPAGTIKLESRKPSQESEAYATVSYGRFNTIDAEGAVSGPLTDTVSARLSISFQNRDDWIDNALTGEDDFLGGYTDFAGRFQLLYDAGGNFTALFNVHLRSLDGTARVFRANIIEQGTGNIIQIDPAACASPAFNPCGTIPFKRSKVFHDSGNEQDLDQWGLIAKLEYDFGKVTLTSITGFETLDLFSQGDVDGGFGQILFLDPPPPTGPGFIAFNSETADGIPDLDQITQELRLSSNGGGPLNFQVGFFFFNEELTVDTFSFDTLFGAGAINGLVVQNQETTDWAFFGTLDYDASDVLHLRGGVRFTNVDKDFVTERFQSPLFGGLPVGPLSANLSDDVFSWDVSAMLEASEDTNLYVRVARGFRAPSVQGRILFQDTISTAPTETIISIETGIKSELMDRRLRLNVTGFWFQVDNQQITQVGGLFNTATLISVAQTDGYGFEAELEWLVTDSLAITGGFSYNFTKIDDPDLRTNICGSGLCTPLDPIEIVGGGSAAVVDGNRLPQAPRLTANFTARYSWPVGNGNEVYIFTDWRYRSRVNFFLYDSVEFRGGTLVEGGVRIGFVMNDGQYELSAFGRNITNDLELMGGIDFSNLTGFVNEPATWGIEVSGRF